MELEGATGLVLSLILTCYGIIICTFTAGLYHLDRSCRKGSGKCKGIPGTFTSVVVPVRNEVKHIIRILEELRNQDYPKHLIEVIVTDDFSEDYTLAFCERFAGQNPDFPIKIITGKLSESGKPGKKQAIERALREARGELILCTDADTTRQPRWISEMVRAYEQEGDQMILGPVSFRDEKMVFQKIQSLEFLGLMAMTAGSSAIGKPIMANGANLAYARSAFRESGGYRENLQYASGDDQFLMASVSKTYGRGTVRFLYSRDAIVQTWAENSLMSFFHQRIRWVSKGKGYRDPLVKGVALVTYLVHFSLLAGMISGLFSTPMFFISFSLWVVKILIDYPGVHIMARFFDKKELLGYYFIAQLFQLFYVVFVGAFGLILPYRWKGRARSDSASVRSSG